MDEAIGIEVWIAHRYSQSSYAAREAPELLAALKAQHEAIDILFAMLIELTSSGCVPTEVFYPSKSGQPWEALLAGKAAIAAAGGKL